MKSKSNSSFGAVSLTPGLDPALRKLKNEYYAQRVLEPPVHFHTKQQANQNKAAGKREASDLTAQLVGNIRWLREKKGWSCKRLAERFNLKTQRVVNLCAYTSWAEIEPCADGLDPELLKD